MLFNQWFIKQSLIIKFLSLLITFNMFPLQISVKINMLYFKENFKTKKEIISFSTSINNKKKYVFSVFSEFIKRLYILFGVQPSA